MIKEIAFNNHEEWLEIRKKYIGGSDAAAVVGLNSFSSPYTVWADKLGKLPPKEDNEAMRLGRDLEDYVAKRFTEQTGKKVRRKNFILWNSDYPFAHANVDRLIVGENAGLECKTTSVLNLKSFKNGEFPANYYVQCMHYMAVTGYKNGILLFLFLVKSLRYLK
jgi:putative phage-type endonuclease